MLLEAWMFGAFGLLGVVNFGLLGAINSPKVSARLPIQDPIPKPTVGTMQGVV